VARRKRCSAHEPNASGGVSGRFDDDGASPDPRTDPAGPGKLKRNKRVPLHGLAHYVHDFGVAGGFASTLCLKTESLFSCFVMGVFFTAWSWKIRSRGHTTKACSPNNLFLIRGENSSIPPLGPPTSIRFRLSCSPTAGYEPGLVLHSFNMPLPATLDGVLDTSPVHHRNRPGMDSFGYGSTNSLRNAVKTIRSW